MPLGALALLAGVARAEAPSAEFVATPLSGVAPLAVSFTDLSTGNPTGWTWRFGDGTTTLKQNPVHVYTYAGDFTVTLVASSPFGYDVEIKNGYVSVVAAPVAEFSASTQFGEPPLSVSFTDLSINTPTEWSWDFGDGQTSSLQNPTHTYTSLGQFSVSLAVSNAYGASTETKPNYVAARPILGEEVRLVAGDPVKSAWLGQAVALDGDRALIGAPTNLSGPSAFGSAYVYVRTPAGWVQEAKLVPSDSSSSDAFGRGVALDGDTALVGAFLADDSGTLDVGAAYVFGRLDGGWALEAKLSTGAETPVDSLGSNVALHGETAVLNGTVGDAYVFSRGLFHWSVRARLVRGDGQVSTLQFPVDISSDGALLGDYFASASGISQAGEALFYDLVPAVVTSRSAGLNPNSYTSGPPLLGGSVAAVVDLSTSGHSLAVLFGFDSPVRLPLSGWQVLLCADLGGRGELLGLPSASGPLASFTLAIPSDLNLLGFSLCTQALHLGAVTPFALSNAQDLVIGTF